MDNKFMYNFMKNHESGNLAPENAFSVSYLGFKGVEALKLLPHSTFSWLPSVFSGLKQLIFAKFSNFW